MAEPAENTVDPLVRPLPRELAALADIALDLRWTWSHAADELWRMLDRDAWERTENPWLILQDVSRRRLGELAHDPAFREQLERVEASRETYLNQSTWYSNNSQAADAVIAYFSMEYGLAEALPLYSGGLGVLAGDHLKTASDLGVPLVAMGLLYQSGYFRQMIDAEGNQLEIYPHNVPSSLPIVPVRDSDGAWLGVHLHLPGRDVLLRLWQARVGRVRLYLLDSNDPTNSPFDRGITSQLYGGGHEMRLVQEMALGIGGWRALEALGLKVDVCHLNEGHAAMVTVERAARYAEQHQIGFREALWATRAGNVFSTHTPVAAAFDTYPAALLAKYGARYADRLGVAPGELLGLGRVDPDNADEPFNLAYLAARTCFNINGVSQLHGEVSRHIFQPLYPRWPQAEVPVSHVTNGVHVPSWDSAKADELWTQACGKDRWLGTLESHGEAVHELTDEALWEMRSAERVRLVEYAREHLALQLGQRGAEREAVAQAIDILDPNALTLGFARRFTAYKRPNLLLTDPERLVRMLTNTQRPVQIIVAGKAHPADQEGRAFVREWIEFVDRPSVRMHAVFLEDYDIALAQELVQGVDLWINTPRRPWEASGTSGMKVLVNGGLNISELDGWWAEAYRPEVGWATGDGREHPEPEWDMTEAGQLYHLLEEEVIPLFYQRDSSGLPRAWLGRIRASMETLAPQFSSNRMLREYVERVYGPALAAYRARQTNDAQQAVALNQWAERLRRHWERIHIGPTEAEEEGGQWQVKVPVYLGELGVTDVRVEMYADPTDSRPMVRIELAPGEALSGAVHGFLFRGAVPADRPSAYYAARVIPAHEGVRIPMELPLIQWQR
jgi:starch phosphorylase